jgi:Domain of unknown function (DUF4411)
MLYLLDANVLITAQNKYYPIEQVPEFWDWVLHHATEGVVKMPREILDEVKAGRKEKDPLLDWLKAPGVAEALELDEEPDMALVQRAINEGYSPNLTEVEIEERGRDPFLVAYGIAGHDRCVVTVETRKPAAAPQNRKLPDACDRVKVRCIDPFEFNRLLGFRTSWRKPT